MSELREDSALYKQIEDNALALSTLVSVAAFGLWRAAKSFNTRSMNRTMESIGIADPNSLATGNFLNWAKPKEILLDRQTAKKVLPEFSVADNALNAYGESRVVRINGSVSHVAQGELASGRAGLGDGYFGHNVRTITARSHRPISVDLIEKNGLNLGPARISQNDLGLTTIRHFSPKQGQVMFRQEGSAEFKDITPYLKSKKEIVLSDGELKISDPRYIRELGEEGITIRLRTNELLDSQRPLNLPKRFNFQSFRLVAGETHHLDGAAIFNERGTSSSFPTWLTFSEQANNSGSKIISVVKGTKETGLRAGNSDRFYWNGSEIKLNQRFNLDGEGILVRKSWDGYKPVFMQNKEGRSFLINDTDEYRGLRGLDGKYIDIF